MAEDFYAFGDMLGEGATATVHRASQRQPGRASACGAGDDDAIPIPSTVAIKTIKKSNELYSAEDVEREVSCMRAVSGHQNVVRLHEVFHSEGAVQLVLDVAVGGELFDVLCARGSFSEAQAKAAVVDLCSALSELHRKGIIHRDLKADNLLVAGVAEGGGCAERILLSDFGLARSVPEDGSQMFECCGSPAYAAPEILCGSGYSGTASDMWSVGVLVYMLLCGYPPFYADDAAALHAGVLRDHDGPRC